MVINKFKHNNSFILSRLSFNFEGKLYDFNGLISLNFDGTTLNVGIKIKGQEWFTSHKSFNFNKICSIQFRKFNHKIHEEYVSKNYKPCSCDRNHEFNWVSGYCGYVLCGNCNGKVAF